VPRRATYLTHGVRNTLKDVEWYKYKQPVEGKRIVLKLLLNTNNNKVTLLNVK
jgi:hypothetical protein